MGAIGRQAHSHGFPTGSRSVDVVLCPTSIAQEFVRYRTRMKTGLWPRIFVSLPKSEDASTVGQMRPITIFALVFRARCGPKSWPDSCFWSYSLPPTVTARLPRRSCVHLAFRNAIVVEKYQIAHTSIGGYVLDITKCF